MRGHIQQRGPETWRLMVFLGRDTTGRQRFATRTVHGTKADAEAAHARLVVEVDEGRHTTTKGSFGDLAERWFEAASPNWADATRRLNRRLLDGHVLPFFGAMALHKIRPADIDRFYARLHAAGLAPATRARIDAVLRRALAQAVRWDELGRNPAERASNRPVNHSKEIDPPTPEEVRKLWLAAEESDPTFAVFVRLAAAIGARRGEVCALRWDDIDLGRGLVMVSRATEPNGAAGRTKSTKTRRRRRVRLDAVTQAVLTHHRELMEQRAQLAGADLGPWVFSSDVACRTPWHPATATHRFARLARSVGISCRLHDLRHFHATQLLDDGVSIVAVQRRLGHARASTLLDVYGHWVPDSDDLAAESIGRVID